MSKPVKNLITAELQRAYAGQDSVLVVNPILLTGKESNQLRGGLQAKQIRMRLIKNSLARRAFADSPLAGAEKLFDGPCALVSGGDSIIDVAKEIIAWTRKLAKLEVRGAVVEGQVLDSAQTAQLAKMPNRREMLGQTVTLINSPGARLASAIGAPAGRIAGCVKALIEKLEQAGAEPGAAPTAAA